MNAWTPLAMALALFIHETGHLIAAAVLRMPVQEVRLFFGRPILRWRMFRVNWSLGWLPIGAYTHMPAAMRDRSLMHRLMVIGAGPLASTLATIIFVRIFDMGCSTPFVWSCAVVNLLLAALSIAPMTGSDSPAMIAAIAEHWYMGRTGRITLGICWCTFPIALLSWAIPLLA